MKLLKSINYDGRRDHMALEAVLPTPKTLRTLLEPIPQNISEGITLEFNEKGLHLQTAMEGLVWAIEEKIAAKEFERYEISHNQHFHLNLKELTDFLKTADAADTLHISLDEENGIMVFKLVKKQMVKEIDLRLLGTADEYKFRELINLQTKLEASLVISTRLFAEAMQISSLGGTHVTLTMSKDRLKLESRGTTKSTKTEIDFENEEVSNVRFEATSEEVSATFAMDYIKNLTKFSKIQDHMLLCFGNNKPVLAIFEFAEEAGYAAIAIAPRSAT